MYCDKDTHIADPHVKAQVRHEMGIAEPWHYQFAHGKFEFKLTHRLCAFVVETHDSVNCQELAAIWIGSVIDCRQTPSKTQLAYFLQYKQLTEIRTTTYATGDPAVSTATQDVHNQTEQAHYERVYERMMDHSGIASKLLRHNSAQQDGIQLTAPHLTDYGFPFMFLESADLDRYDALMIFHRNLNDRICVTPDSDEFGEVSENEGECDYYRNKWADLNEYASMDHI